MICVYDLMPLVVLDVCAYVMHEGKIFMKSIVFVADSAN